MTSPKNLTWSITSDENEFREMRDEWERLFVNNPRHSPFLAWGWVNAWIRHLAQPHRLRILVLRNQDNELQMVIPLLAHHSSAGNRNRQLTNLCGYGPECSDHLGFLRLPAYDNTLHELSFAGITQCLGENSRIRLNSLDDFQSFPKSLQRTFESHGRKVRLIDTNVCPMVELPTTWENFLLTLSRNFRSQIRRQYKRAMQGDNLVIRSIDPGNPGDVEEFAIRLIQLNRSRMSETGRQSSLEDERFRAFLTEAIAYMAPNGTAWLDVLEDKNGIVGAAVNLVHGKFVYYYMGGFEDKLTKSGPGNVLFVHIIKRAIDQGYTVYDFLRGAESYKYRWRATDRPIQQLDVYPSGFWRGTLNYFKDGTTLKLRRMKSRIRGRR